MQVEEVVRAVGDRDPDHRRRSWTEHRDHSQFRAEGWPFERRIGFSCSCCNEEHVWSWSLSEISLVPEVRAAYFDRRGTQTQIEAKEMVVATKKAAKLLRRHLDKDQKSEFRRFKHFHVRSSDGFLYRIENSSCWNVSRVEDGEVTAKFCVIFKVFNIPIPDQMLIQKFMLQSHPDQFFKIANKNYHPETMGDAFVVPAGDGFANLAGINRLQLEAPQAPQAPVVDPAVEPARRRRRAA